MRTALVVLLAGSLLTGGLHAQRLHEGFWIGFAPGGIGYSDGEGLVYPLHFRLGGTVNRQLLVGFEWFAVVLDDLPSTVAVNYSATALFYPSKSGGAFAKVGVGLGRASSRCPNRPGDALEGIGATIGVGYDVRLGRNIYFTPVVDAFWQGGERILCPVPGQPDAGTVRAYSPALLFTVGLMWH